MPRRMRLRRGELGHPRRRARRGFKPRGRGYKEVIRGVANVYPSTFQTRLSMENQHRQQHINEQAGIRELSFEQGLRGENQLLAQPRRNHPTNRIPIPEFHL